MPALAQPNSITPMGVGPAKPSFMDWLIQSMSDRLAATGIAPPTTPTPPLPMPQFIPPAGQVPGTTVPIGMPSSSSPPPIGMGEVMAGTGLGLPASAALPGTASPPPVGGAETMAQPALGAKNPNISQFDLMSKMPMPGPNTSQFDLMTSGGPTAPAPGGGGAAPPPTASAVTPQDPMNPLSQVQAPADPDVIKPSTPGLPGPKQIDLGAILAILNSAAGANQQQTKLPFLTNFLGIAPQR